MDETSALKDSFAVTALFSVRLLFVLEAPDYAPDIQHILEKLYVLNQSNHAIIVVNNPLRLFSDTEEKLKYIKSFS